MPQKISSICHEHGRNSKFPIAIQQSLKRLRSKRKHFPSANYDTINIKQETEAGFGLQKPDKSIFYLTNKSFNIVINAAERWHLQKTYLLGRRKSTSEFNLEPSISSTSSCQKRCHQVTHLGHLSPQLQRSLESHIS